MIKISIPASKIAGCIGMNPYVTITDTIIDYFKFKGKGTFQKLELKNQLCNSDRINLAKSLNLPKESSIIDIQNEFKKKLSELAYSNDKQKEFINKIDNESIKNALNSDITMRKGVNNEKKDLDRLQKKENIIIGERNSKLGSLVINISNKYEIKITGRTDGYCESKNCIIETKHRKNKLFGRVPTYEKVQCEVYMRMFNCDKCYHTETFSDESNETLLEKDDNFWKEITRNLRKEFIPEYIKIMNYSQ